MGGINSKKMKKISLILLSLSALFLVSCESEGHKNMSEFIDKYTDTNPIWWDTSRRGVNIKEAFAEKMTSDIYFAKSMAENLGNLNSNYVHKTKVLGYYERHDDSGKVIEYGQVIQFEIHSRIRMKIQMPNGKNSIRVSYNIISLAPASRKRKFERIPYIYRDTCGENKVSNLEIENWIDSNCDCHQSVIMLRLGTYIFADKTSVFDFTNTNIGWRDGNSQDNIQTTKDSTNNLTVTAVEDISGKIFSMEEYEESLKPFTKEGDWYVSIKEAPQYGDYFDSLFEYIKEQSSSIEPKVKTSGDIYIGFFVDKGGKVSNVNVIKDYGGYGENFKKIIESMPKWNPGSVNGKPVKCFVGLSITLNIK